MNKDIEGLWQLYQQANQAWFRDWTQVDDADLEQHEHTPLQLLVDLQYAIGQYVMAHRREQQERIAFDHITPMPDFQRRCEFSKQIGKMAQRYFSAPCLILLGELSERLFEMNQYEWKEAESAWLKAVNIEVELLLEACVPGVVAVLAHFLKGNGASLPLKKLRIAPIYCVENSVSDELKSLANQTLACAIEIFARARVQIQVLPASTWAVPKCVRDVVVFDQNNLMAIEQRAIWTVDNHWSERDVAHDSKDGSLSSILRDKRPNYLEDGVIEVVFLDDILYTEFEKDDFMTSFSEIANLNPVLAQYQMSNPDREIVVAQNLVGLTPYYGEVVVVSAPFYQGKHIQSHVVVAHELMHRLGALGHACAKDNLLYHAPDTQTALENIHLSPVQLAAIYSVIESY
jgi:hypothetical protein